MNNYEWWLILVHNGGYCLARIRIITQHESVKPLSRAVINQLPARQSGALLLSVLLSNPSNHDFLLGNGGYLWQTPWTAQTKRQVFSRGVRDRLETAKWNSVWKTEQQDFTGHHEVIHYQAAEKRNPFPGCNFKQVGFWQVDVWHFRMLTPVASCQN